MNQLLNYINPVTVFIYIIAAVPIIAGAAGVFSRYRIQRSVLSLLESIGFIGCMLLSILATREIFIQRRFDVFIRIYELVPQEIKGLLQGKDILTYIAVVPLLMLVVTLVLRVALAPLYRKIAVVIGEGVYNVLSKLGPFVRSLVSSLWELPRAVMVTLLFTLVLSGYAYILPTPMLGRWMNESKPYQYINTSIFRPILNTSLAKEIPVLFNDYFRDAAAGKIGEQGGPAAAAGNLAKQLASGNIRVIEYFNGVTIDEAIKSSPEIDETARRIVGQETSSKRKAYLLYKWISTNVRYDYEKAEKVSSDPRGIQSGALVAYNTRKGICFDYSSLYVSMCRAVGLKVRLVTGLGYSGVSWGDHAWNQVYSNEEQRWINVDTTFGSAGNYFDKRDFAADHRYDDIQGEW